ncbi:MAG: nucleotidyltransferase family protein, partial [Alteraurantiacibacter sp.]|nr:nucleotidyltransferase family protein [Alteraurantiacibacter sp.]
VSYSAAVDSWPASVADPVRDEARLQILWESSHREWLVGLLAQLEEAEISALLLKGTALAYLVHDEPAVRRRGDTDLLIRETHLPATRALLEKLGMVRSRTGNFGQEVWRHDTGIGFIHCLDLHWEVAPAPFLRQVLDVEECFSHAIPLPRLAPQARTLSRVQLFVRGVVNEALHRTAGYLVDDEMCFEERRLIWQLDAHRLACGFGDAEWDELAILAVERGMAPVCLDALQAIVSAFQTPVPMRVCEQLSAQPPSTAVSRYLDQRSGQERLWDDLAVLPDLTSRIRLLANHLFPPESFMRSRFPGRENWPLVLLHFYRLCAGGWQALTRSLRA